MMQRVAQFTAGPAFVKENVRTACWTRGDDAWRRRVATTRDDHGCALAQAQTKRLSGVSLSARTTKMVHTKSTRNSQGMPATPGTCDKTRSARKWCAR